MKKFISLSLIVAFSAIIAFSGCKKYEDGPLFSLASKKSRVVNNWKVEKVMLLGFDVSGLYEGFSMEMKNDNTYNISWGGLSSVETGAWDFDSAKEKIITTPDGSTIDTEWEILRLKSNELWVRTPVNGTLPEFHIVTK